MSELRKLWDFTEMGGFTFESELGIQRTRFVSESTEECITKNANFFLRKDALTLATELAGLVGSEVTGYESNCYLLLGKWQDHKCLIWVKGNTTFEDRPINAWVVVTGHREAVEGVIQYALAQKEIIKQGCVKWWFKQANGAINNHSITLDDGGETIYPEYYPDLKGGPFKFFEEYLNSSSSVWILGGVPGTGKTTLLRKMITTHKLMAHVVYDPQIMADDGVLNSFLFSEGDVMIFEDAEQLIIPRLNGNEVMTKFLNASNGLVKLPKKKIIFTTNALNRSKIDQALMREGRCFAVTSLEPFNQEQALAACKVGGLPPPTRPQKEYTLAQLFNPPR